MRRLTDATLLCGLCAAILAVLVGLGGCSTEKYKAEADTETYQIIDQKWTEDFGTQANYRISDVNPSPQDIAIDPNFVPTGPITLPQAVAIATAHNRDYQQRKEQLYLIALDLTLARHDFARQWFGTFDPYYLNDPEDEQLTYEASVGFNQLLADGAQISASVALDWARFLTGDPRTSLGSVLTATITQPLLRGAGRKVVQENLTQAERQVLYQIRSFNRFRKSFVVSVVNAYYRVLQGFDEVQNAQSNYERRQESKQRLEMEAQAGRRNRFEVDQAKQDTLRARDSLVRAQQSYEQGLDEFKILLALPTDANITLDQHALQQLRDVGVTVVGYTLEQAADTAFLRRLDLANSADKVDDAARKVIVAADNLGAELNLVGKAAVSSTPPTEFERLQFHLGSYALGFEADLPFDRKLERNAYRESLISLTQAQRQYDLDRDNVVLQVRQAYRQLTEAAQRYQIQENSLNLAQQRVESTSMLLQAGRLTTRDLLESQDALLEAQNNLTAALVDHAIAKLNFYRDVGVLQVKPDGMWQEE